MSNPKKSIIGHQRTLGLLVRESEKKELGGTYLFIGPESVGKFTTAMWWAEKITGSEKEINPDIFVLQPEIFEEKNMKREKDIPIEKVRELQKWMGLTAVGGKTKVAIIDRADRLSIESQNSILKSLEEPRKGVVMILATADDSFLLPTVVSRCRKIKFNLVSNDVIKKIPDLAQDDLEFVLFWALGRPGLAFMIGSESEERKFRKEAISEVKKIFSTDLNEKLAMADSISRDKPLLIKRMELWMIVLRHTLLNSLFHGKRGISENRVYLSICKIEVCLERIKRSNINSRLVLESLLISIH